MALSDKEQEILLSEDIYFRGYPTKDVKEFIRELKEKIQEKMDVTYEIFEIINQLAGEKLITQTTKEKGK